MPTMAGDLVYAREALWRVTHVRAAQERVRLVSLRGADDHNRWQHCTLLEPFDRVTPRSIHETPRVVSRRRWMHALASIVAAAGCGADADANGVIAGMAADTDATAVNAGIAAGAGASATAAARPPIALASLADASVTLLAYQLEPLLAIVRGVASRVLIADGVGLGKTIEAALVLRELAARHRGSSRAARMLVVVPAGLRDQWRRELRARVGLDSRIIDAHALAARLRELPSDVNPWSLPGISIVSLDFVKQDVVLHGLRDCVWDALVLDEAHALTPGTDRAAGADLLAQRSRLVLLLTATPHDGDDASFDALCRTGRHHGHEAEPIAVFRRTRESLGLPGARRVHVLRVTPTPAERHLHHLLARYVMRVEREQHPAGSAGGENILGEMPGSTAAESIAAARTLAMTVLQKRASSSAWSLARSLEHRLALLAQAESQHETQALPPQPTQRPLPFALNEPATADAAVGAGAEAGAGVEAETNLDDDEPLACLSTPGLASARVERAWLMLLIRAAHRAARASHESKLHALRRLLARIREPAIVYTEYRDTLKHLAAALPPPLTVLHGGLTREAREDALHAFATGRVNVMLATDAAGEGLNLHQRCRLVINVELPWNPNRLEQRIGRVDRLGQSKTVHAFHLVSPGTAEAVLLDTLKHRITRINESLRSGEKHDDTNNGVRTWPNLSTQAAESVRTLERLRGLRTAVAAATRKHDPLIELDARAPWISRARARDRGPLAAVPRGTICIWRTRLRFAFDTDAELITALHVRWPWPIPSAAREAMQRRLDTLAREAVQAHDAREQAFRDRGARRDRAILATLRDARTHADRAAVDAHLREPLLFNDIAAARATRLASHQPPPRPVPPTQPRHTHQAPPADAQADPSASVDFDHKLLLVLRVR